MKKTFILLVFAFLSGSFFYNASAGEIVFEYDDAGNCILKRKTIVLQKVKQQIDDELNAEPETGTLGNTTIVIHPNPTHGVLLIEINGDLSEAPYQVNLSNTSGKLMQQKHFSDSALTLDMTEYPAGVYILQIKQGKEAKEWKIIKE